ncbi:MAG: hypothetical protein SF187_06655 [Deltaproteobacteria bacterium]|nr:hypothetical protein [Deltaproteobacteria bacterium]
MVTEDFNISYYSNNGTSNLNVRPSLDYFFTDRLSIGGRLGLSWYSSNGNSNQSRSIAWRFGANFGLGEKVSIWLTLENGIVLPENSSNLLFTNLVFPVLLHPAPHFFVGIGPYLDGQRTLGESESDVDFGGGLTSFVGGWW